jgi:hypothetical protein
MKRIREFICENNRELRRRCSEHRNEDVWRDAVEFRGQIERDTLLP